MTTEESSRPLVSVLVDSDAAESSVGKQDYPRVEAVRIESATAERRMESLATGLGRAGGEFVVHLPEGDSLLPEAISALAAVLADQKSVALVYPSFQRVDADGVVLGTVVPEEYDAVEMMRMQYAPAGPGAMFRRAGGERALQSAAATSRRGELPFMLRLAAQGPVRRLLDPLARRRVGFERRPGGPEAARELLHSFERLVGEFELPPGSESSLRTAARSACVLAAAEVGGELDDPEARFFIADRFGELQTRAGDDDVMAEVAVLQAEITNLEQRLARHRALLPLLAANVAARESWQPGVVVEERPGWRRRLSRLRRVGDA